MPCSLPAPLILFHNTPPSEVSLLVYGLSPFIEHKFHKNRDRVHLWLVCYNIPSVRHVVGAQLMAGE